MSPFMLAWVMTGALGAIFCVWALGGPESLPDFLPLSIKGAARLVMACAIGGFGGILGGMLIQGANAAALGADPQSTGGNFGAALGIFLAPFLTFGLYHTLEYRLRQLHSPRTSLGWRVLGSAGWVVVLVAPALGFLVGGNLGHALGAYDFLLGAVLVPFAAGTLVFMVPLLFWLISQTDSCYQWDNEVRPRSRAPGSVAGD